MSQSIILASSSTYRKELLNKLKISFSSVSPEIDETPHAGENADALVQRLSLAKAKKVAEIHEDAIIIASDQVATLYEHILTKPHSRENAIAQLNQQSGQCVTFHTGLCVLNSCSQNYELTVEKTKVYFKNLSLTQIENYLDQEPALDCAGSFKSEGLGITLFEKISTDDPNSLVGLPLIKTVSFLEKFGIKLP